MKIYSRRTRILFRITVPLVPVPPLLIGVGIWCSGQLQTHLQQTGGLFFIVAAVMCAATAFSADDDSYMQKELKLRDAEREWQKPSGIQDIPRNDAGSRSW